MARGGSSSSPAIQALTSWSSTPVASAATRPRPSRAGRAGRVRPGIIEGRGCSWRAGGEQVARPRAVHRDLRLEGVEPGEALLGADEVDQLDLEAAAVDVLGEVEQMGLQADVLAGDGRA